MRHRCRGHRWRVRAVRRARHRLLPAAASLCRGRHSWRRRRWWWSWRHWRRQPPWWPLAGTRDAVGRPVTVGRCCGSSRSSTTAARLPPNVLVLCEAVSRQILVPRQASTADGTFERLGFLRCARHGGHGGARLPPTNTVGKATRVTEGGWPARRVARTGHGAHVKRLVRFSRRGWSAGSGCQMQPRERPGSSQWSIACPSGGGVNNQDGRETNVDSPWLCQQDSRNVRLWDAPRVAAARAS